MYIVSEEDLIKGIEGFPLEIVQEMVSHQVAQGNKGDVKVFQNSASASSSGGGFDWDKTEREGISWSKVIQNKNFELFSNHDVSEVPIDPEYSQEEKVFMDGIITGILVDKGSKGSIDSQEYVLAIIIAKEALEVRRKYY